MLQGKMKLFNFLPATRVWGTQSKENAKTGSTIFISAESRGFWKSCMIMVIFFSCHLTKKG